MRHQSLSIAVPSRRRLRRSSIGLCAVMLLLASACGASAGTAETATAGAVDVGATQPDPTASDPVEADENTAAPAASDDSVDTAGDDEEPVAQAASAAPSGQGTFELVLDNGTSYSAPVRCALEPQIAADQEILYTASGNGEDIFVDITVWGETQFGFTESVEVVDNTTYDNLWRSTRSTGLVLELNGTVITGSGGFYQGEDLNGELTNGTFTANC